MSSLLSLSFLHLEIYIFMGDIPSKGGILTESVVNLCVSHKAPTKILEKSEL